MRSAKFRPLTAAQLMLMKLETYNCCRKITHHAQWFCQRQALLGL